MLLEPKISKPSKKRWAARVGGAKKSEGKEQGKTY